MLTFLLIVHALITATLVGVILMQRSEGGGLGMGGSPTGLMSARGAADFLTRATTILATLFVGLSIVSAVVVSRGAAPSKIDTSLARQTPAAPAPAPSVPLNGDPIAAVADSVTNSSVPAAAPVATTLVPTPTLKVERKPVAASPTSRPGTTVPVPRTEKPATVPTPNATVPVILAAPPAPVTTPPAGNGN